MKILQTTMASVILAMLLGSSIAVADPANFDFYGCMQSIPTTSGGSYKMVGFLTNNGVVPTPIPFNWVGEEHTVVIEATLNNISGFTENYSGATVKISSYAGSVDWTGGTRLGEMGANTTGYGIGGSGNTGSGNIPSGYVDCWDGKIDQPIIAVDEASWGQVKRLFH